MEFLSKLKNLLRGNPSMPSYRVYERASVKNPEEIERQYNLLEQCVSDFAYTHGWIENNQDSGPMCKAWSYGYFNIRICSGGGVWGSLYGFSLLATDMRVWNAATDVERASGFFKDKNINFGGWTYTKIDEEELTRTKKNLEILQTSMMKENWT